MGASMPHRLRHASFCAFSILFAFLLSLGGCQKKEIEELFGTELFSLSLGKLENQIDLFQQTGAPVEKKNRIFMRDGWFYVANGNSDKIMVFTSYGDLISLLYNPQTNPTPALQALDPAVSDSETSSGTVSTRGSVAYPFTDIGEIAVASDKTLYVEDAVTEAKVVKDTARGVLLSRVVLRFDRKGRPEGYLGQEGIGGTPFPYIMSLNVTARDQLVIVTRLPESWEVFWFSREGRLLYQVEIDSAHLPAAPVKGATQSLVNIIPDQQSPFLYLMIYAYRDPSDDTGRSGSPPGDDVISRVYKLNLLDREYDSFVELPQNPSRKETAGLKTTEIPAPPSDLVGVSSAGYYYLLGFADSNLYTLQILDPAGQGEGAAIHGDRGFRAHLPGHPSLSYRPDLRSSRGSDEGARHLVALRSPHEGGLTMKVVSSEAMARIDRQSQAEFAIPSLLLMEDAGVTAWSTLETRVCRGQKPQGPMVFLAGKGNNGGDAFVMARRAFCGGERRLSIVLAAGRPAPDSDPGRMLAMCASHGVEVLAWPAQGPEVLGRLGEAAWIFDGIAGTGLQGGLRAPLGDLVKAVNASAGTRVAIDVPSGVGDAFDPSAPAVQASVTLTMGLPKLCLYLPRARGLCGRIYVVPVGFPAALVEDPSIPGEMLPHAAWREIARPIPVDTHKNRRGHLAVFAGAPGTTGAAWLCSNAAARSRVGLVSLYAGGDTWQVQAQKSTSVMVKPWVEPRSPDWSGPDLAGYSGILVGPGWGLSEGKERWLEHLVSGQIPGVIDADGITLLSRIAARGSSDLGGRWVLTPHPGEFSRLSGQPRDEVLADPVRHALAQSARLGAVIALKGHCTVVASPSGRFWILDGPNPALATAGSGDVLSGIIAAGIAGGMSALDAALFGVSLHAHVGRAARKSLGWFLAEDLVPVISRTLR